MSRFPPRLVSLLMILSLLYVVVLIRTTTTITENANDNERFNHPNVNSFLLDLSTKTDKNSSNKASTAALVEAQQARMTTTSSAAAATEMPRARFVFIIGIEGTGHNLMKDIIKDSPAAKRAKKLGLWPTIDILHNLLHAPKAGLLNLHCGYKLDEETGLPDVAGKLEKVVTRLKEIASKIEESSAAKDQDDQFVSIPLNVITHEMASYPQDSDDCRPLKYPNLDLLYKACHEAGVACQHLYLYRDPYAVLKSTTTNRGFERSGLKAIHLYITMLKIIYAQLATHSKGTMGCFGFYDENITALFWDPIRDMFGWANGQDKFFKYIKSKYKPPPVLADKDRESIVPHKYNLYMQSMIQANDNVIGLCRRQLAENYKS